MCTYLYITFVILHIPAMELTNKLKRFSMKQKIRTIHVESSAKQLPECGRDSGLNAAYHSGATMHRVLTSELSNAGKPQFFLGIEIEKEDENFNFGNAQLKQLLKWRRERDGSLGYYGFELISPIYSLTNVRALIKDLSHPVLQAGVNCGSSERCGNHYHLSASHLTVPELAAGMAYLMPLLYAMYPNRLNNSYCAPKRISGRVVYSVINGDIRTTLGDRYEAMNIGEKTVELRIFPAVKNLRQLVFRLNIIRTYLHQLLYASPVQVIAEICDTRSVLHGVLSGVYNSPDKIENLLFKYASYSIQYEQQAIAGNQKVLTREINEGMKAVRKSMKTAFTQICES